MRQIFQNMGILQPQQQSQDPQQRLVRIGADVAYGDKLSKARRKAADEFKPTGRHNLEGIAYAVNQIHAPFADRYAADKQAAQKEAMIKALEATGDLSELESLMIMEGGSAAIQPIMQGRMADQRGSLAHQRALEIAERQHKYNLERDAKKLEAKGAQREGILKPGRLDVQNMREQKQKVDALEASVSTFRPEYGGIGYTGTDTEADWRLWIAKRFSGRPEEEKAAAQWWSTWQQYNVLEERNEMFGSALTENETKEWNKAAIQPSMTPQQIQDNLQIRRMIMARKYVEGLRSNARIYGTETPTAVYGVDAADDDAVLARGAQIAGVPPEVFMSPNYASYVYERKGRQEEIKEAETKQNKLNAEQIAKYKEIAKKHIEAGKNPDAVRRWLEDKGIPTPDHFQEEY